ncbi:Lrp/AsnC family transcriptional regulator [Roseicyclus sp. F158]|uniref:Lrp/AsnC family transcriptional regulator n=1 Tax=Tropicimonas omnivorans TaxID=3075590 RepID=A0ABU3DD25_9RHOB|nr:MULTISPECIES: Lrp/AsnC family transcriptional regulator [Roseobacteraceae]MDT0681620.1 Lrp/AsnC family transcriptional regulator [Roseicyclus sp. F158]
MDRLDLALLAALEDNARLSYAELAEREGLSKTPVWKRIKAMEEAGVIEGYAARLSSRALGFEILALVELSLAPEDAEAFEVAVRRLPAIYHCVATTGEADYILQVLARDMDDLDRLIRKQIVRLPGVRRTKTSVVTRVVKARQSIAGAASMP